MRDEQTRLLERIARTNETIIAAHANVIGRLDEIEKKGNGEWHGIERRKDAVLSDDQRKAIREEIDERLKLHLGDLTLRVFMLAIGTACTVGVGALIAWFSLKAK